MSSKFNLNILVLSKQKLYLNYVFVLPAMMYFNITGSNQRFRTPVIGVLC